MNNYSPFYILILNLILFNTTVLFAQQTDNTGATYSTFDEFIGLENTNLYQGKLYIENYRTINDQKQFFKSTEFLNGNVWYRGQPYFNQLIKYDVYEDELLLKLKGNGNTLKLSKKDIDSFSIGQNYFLNLKPKKTATVELLGYYEVLFQDHMFILYAKHNKNIRERRDDNYAYYEFKDGKTKYLLLYNGEYHTLNTKKDIFRVFPNHKKNINKLYRNAKKINKKDSDALMISVVKQLESVI